MRYAVHINLLLMLLVAPTITVGQCSNPAASAADALAAKFDAHQFVLIGSTHGGEKIEQFLMCLVSRGAFKQRATDIVVESASSSAANQRLIDRYVLNLEDIRPDDLTPIWLVQSKGDGGSRAVSVQDQLHAASPHRAPGKGSVKQNARYLWRCAHPY